MSPNGDPQLHRDLGRIEGRLKAVEDRTTGMATQVEEIHRAMLQAAGGWKVLLAVGAIAGTLGALAMKALAIVGIGR